MTATRPRTPPLDPDAIVEEATARTGLHDLGDHSHREGLDRLVASLREEARLNELGTATLVEQVVSAVAARLEVLEWSSRHPEATADGVAAPIVIVGLPRTGTTLLSNLLALDPAHRSLMFWESVRPVPPPDPLAWPTDPRVGQAAAELEALYAVAPRFRAMHPMEATWPNECVVVLAQHFRTVHFEVLAALPSYGEWNDHADQRPAYAHHRRVLQVLQSRLPGERWSLKSPAHLGQLDALTAVYPDAVLVWTHRDPAVALASLVNLNTTLHGVFSDHVDLPALTARWTAWMERSVERGRAFREAAADGGRGGPLMVDLLYRDVVADPVGALRRLYAAMDREVSPVMERRVRAYLEANPRDKHGRHRYDLADLGLHEGEVRERFEGYRSAFEIPGEAR